ncbi:hypothetical protein [Prosthecomicrobium sp. N25]|uniref:hypothetical protein n=1 Tax=Prosthecomicrobium sp. N25 TaxID=3129254 RepID=UPI0030775355
MNQPLPDFGLELVVAGLMVLVILALLLLRFEARLLGRTRRTRSPHGHAPRDGRSPGARLTRTMGSKPER